MTGGVEGCERGGRGEGRERGKGERSGYEVVKSELSESWVLAQGVGVVVYPGHCVYVYVRVYTGGVFVLFWIVCNGWLGCNFSAALEVLLVLCYCLLGLATQKGLKCYSLWALQGDCLQAPRS